MIQWPSSELEHITFVTRAVRVIDLITNLDMASFQTHTGLNTFIARLQSEVDTCRLQQPFQIVVERNPQDRLTSAMEQAETIHDPEYLAAQQQAEEEARAREAAAQAAAEKEEETEAKVDEDGNDGGEESMEVDPSPTPPAPQIVVPATSILTSGGITAPHTAPKTGITCLPQRAALLKSMLNFLKKAIQVAIQ